jgi:beta-N-acetylhexosaminidase
MLTKEKLPAIMSGHLAFPQTPGGRAPASLSSWFLRDLLRERIGYQGIVVTDDLMMNGAAVFAGGISAAAKQALMAGNDIIMLSQTPELASPVWVNLLKAMKSEKDFRERVRDAARRVLTVKLEYLRGDEKVPYIPDLTRVATELPDPEGTAFFLDLAARSVTIVKGAPDPGAPGSGSGAVFPLSPEKAGRVLLAGQFNEFLSAGKLAYPQAVSHRYSTGDVQGFLRLAGNADTVIFCLADAGGLSLLRRLRGLGKRVIVFSVLSPAYLDEAAWVDGALAVYSYAKESFIAGFSAMLGRYRPEGRLPFPSEPGRELSPSGPAGVPGG